MSDGGNGGTTRHRTARPLDLMGVQAAVEVVGPDELKVDYYYCMQRQKRIFDLGLISGLLRWPVIVVLEGIQTLDESNTDWKELQ